MPEMINTCKTALSSWILTYIEKYPVSMIWLLRSGAIIDISDINAGTRQFLIPGKPVNISGDIVTFEVTVSKPADPGTDTESPAVLLIYDE